MEDPHIAQFFETVMVPPLLDTMVPCNSSNVGEAVDSLWWESLLSLPETEDDQLIYSDTFRLPSSPALDTPSSSSISISNGTVTTPRAINSPMGIKKRTSTGRRKIEVKKIEKVTSLRVTFSKRRQGLFRKAADLSVLTGADVAVFVMSPAGKIFSFGCPSPDHLIHRLQSLTLNHDGLIVSNDQYQPLIDQNIDKYALETGERCGDKGTDWWKEDIDNFELRQLEKFKEAMEVLHSNVTRKIRYMEETKYLL